MMDDNRATKPSIIINQSILFDMKYKMIRAQAESSLNILKGVLPSCYLFISQFLEEVDFILW